VTDAPTHGVTVSAPAKLTLSLQVTGVRADGYHLLRSEMVSLDLADSLTMTDGRGLTLSTEHLAGREGQNDGGISTGPDNLVSRALGAVGRSAHVHLVKRIPPGAGLGGGSTDAAAVMRWAGCSDPEVAVSLGADVPFCLAGGRALVEGIGEALTPMPFERRHFLLVLLPFGVDTAAVYRAYDELNGGVGPARRGTGGDEPDGNDLERPALVVEPRLGPWRSAFRALTGREPHLAGSGSTWFVEGTPEELGLDGHTTLEVAGELGALVPATTMPASTTPPISVPDREPTS
jgi:4-diphosphocytidyl-2-C-methyl-D-erythritol kinase